MNGEPEMNFNGRRVPMEVMDTILLFWMIGVLIIGAALLWLRYKGSASTKRPPQPATASSP